MLLGPLISHLIVSSTPPSTACSSAASTICKAWARAFFSSAARSGSLTSAFGLASRGRCRPPYTLIGYVASALQRNLARAFFSSAARSGSLASASGLASSGRCRPGAPGSTSAASAGDTPLPAPPGRRTCSAQRVTNCHVTVMSMRNYRTMHALLGMKYMTKVSLMHAVHLPGSWQHLNHLLYLLHKRSTGQQLRGLNAYS